MEKEPAEVGKPPGRGRYNVLLYLLIVLAALDVLVGAFRKTWGAYESHHYRIRMADCSSQKWDLVVVGGSPAMYGFDPAILAGANWQGHRLERVYNLGLPLGTAAEICLAVEHALSAPPRLLVYGVSATDFNEDRVEPNGPRELMSLSDVAGWIGGRPEAGLWCLRHYTDAHLTGGWQLFRHRAEIRLWLAEQLENLCPGLCPDVAAEARTRRQTRASLRSGHGYLPAGGRLDRLKAEGRVSVSSFPFLDRYRIDGYPRYLHLLLDWAERHEVTVILVDLPVPADLDQRLYPQIYGSYRAVLETVAHRRGVRLLRATREAVGLTDADFGDLIHLNASGAARLSTWLRQQLSGGVVL
jgi:hypothetical protein